MSWAERLERQWWATSTATWTLVLWPLALLYRVILTLRAWLYRRGLLRAERAPVPVIVVGNLVVGGAGKTPTTIALVQALLERGWHPGVVSRGHGRRDGSPREVRALDTAPDCGDEPLLIKRRTGVPVWVAARRIQAARGLCAQHPEVDVLIADDGLQHLAMQRDSQVIVFDERGVGNGWLLPCGPLREIFKPAPPGRSIVVYNAPQPSTAWPGIVVHRRLAGALAFRTWYAARSSSVASLEQFRGAPVSAMAGIAVPQRFFSMLEAEGLTVMKFPLRDHAAITEQDWPPGEGPVLITEKDAVKVHPDSPLARRLWVVPLDLALPPKVVDQVCEFARMPISAEGK